MLLCFACKTTAKSKNSSKSSTRLKRSKTMQLLRSVLIMTEMLILNKIVEVACVGKISKLYGYIVLKAKNTSTSNFLDKRNHRHHIRSLLESRLYLLKR